MPLDIRKLVVHLEEVRAEGGRDDAGGPLRKVAAMAVLGAPVESYGKAALAGLALTNRGRLNARLGGLAKEVVGQDGLR
jgi:hypothetical protein